MVNRQLQDYYPTKLSIKYYQRTDKITGQTVLFRHMMMLQDLLSVQVMLHIMRTSILDMKSFYITEELVGICYPGT